MTTKEKLLRDAVVTREKLQRDAVVNKCMKQFNLKRSMNILRYRNGNAMTNKALVSTIVREAINKMDDSNDGLFCRLF